MGSTPRNTTMLLRYLPLALGLVLIVYLAVVQGHWSDRWGDSNEAARELAERVKRVPRTIGPWEAEELPVDPRQLKASGAVGHVSLGYRNGRGDRVSLYIVCGHMRDISVHTPDRCYPAAGFQSLGTPVKQTVEYDSSSVEFLTTTFQMDSPEGVVQQRVFWTWGHDGRWLAPEWPRSTFRGVRALYKMYLISAMPRRDQHAEESPCVAFAQEALSTINGVLFESSGDGR